MIFFYRRSAGVVHRRHGVFIFPDVHAMQNEKHPQHCDSVRFAARELWGDGVLERDVIYIDCFEEYLEPA